jgi:hypothetical protein
MHQQLWGYKVEWKSVSRGTGGKKVEYHWSKARTVFNRSNTEIVGSNPARGRFVRVSVVLSCVGSGLATGWSPVQGVLPNAQK